MKVTPKMRKQWRSLTGIPIKRIARLWGVHTDTVQYHLDDEMAARRRQQWRTYKQRNKP